jgi:hypothetical protein
MSSKENEILQDEVENKSDKVIDETGVFKCSRKKCELKLPFSSSSYESKLFQSVQMNGIVKYFCRNGKNIEEVLKNIVTNINNCKTICDKVKLQRIEKITEYAKLFDHNQNGCYYKYKQSCNYFNKINNIKAMYQLDDDDDKIQPVYSDEDSDFCSEFDAYRYD